jgi:transposase-like protein
MSQQTPEPAPEPVRCPFCQASDAQLISLFGSQLLLSQYRCHRCGSYFEGLRDDRSEASPRQETSHGR